MMGDIDRLKDDAWKAIAQQDWTRLSGILGTLERVWTDDDAARIFYTQLAQSAHAKGAPAAVSDKVKTMQTINQATLRARKPSPAATAFVERMTAARNSGLEQAAKTRAAKPVAAKPVEPAAKPATTKPVKPAPKPAAAKPKPAAKPAVPNAATKPVAGNPAKYVAAFTRTFDQLLRAHGYTQDAKASSAELVIFASRDTRVEITNPGQAGGSARAPYTVTRKGKKPATGAGRDSLADTLGVPRLVR